MITTLPAGTRRAHRGFSLIELMVTVAIVGVLAAIAIPLFMSHLRTAKEVEPLLQLNMLAKNAKTLYQTGSRYPQGVAAVLPGADGTACTSPGGRFAATTAWSTDPMWLELDFHLEETNLFSYHYESSATDVALATAVGDLDCDTKLITFRLELGVVEGNPSTTIVKPVDGSD